MIDREEAFNTLYDIAAAWKDEHPHSHIYQYVRYVDIYLVDGQPTNDIHHFLDDIEEDLDDWYLDDSMSEALPSVHEYWYQHYEKKDLYFHVNFHPSNCRTVKTGRMIPETKQVCGDYA